MLSTDEKKLLLKICRLYYFDEWTQADIAKKMGVSRPIISKLLQKARNEGLVEIIVHDDSFHTIELEQKIEKAFPISDVLVVPTVDMPSDTAKSALAKAAAGYVSKTIRDAKKVGVSWGTTLFELVKEYPYENREQIKVIPLVGGMGSNRIELHSNQIAFELSKKLNGTCESLYAPAIVETRELRDLFVQTPNLDLVLEEARQCDLALVGIGNPFVNSTMEQIGYLKEEEMDDLRRAKVVADINSCFIKADGSIARNTINDKVIGIDVEELRNVDKVIAIAAGTHKAESIMATLRGGYLDVLITDDLTAYEILKILT